MALLATMGHEAPPEAHEIVETLERAIAAEDQVQQLQSESLHAFLSHAWVGYEFGRVAYNAYCEYSAWKSLATGADLPQWEAVSIDIRLAWLYAVSAVYRCLIEKTAMPQVASQKDSTQHSSVWVAELKKFFQKSAKEAPQETMAEITEEARSEQG